MLTGGIRDSIYIGQILPYYRRHSFHGNAHGNGNGFRRAPDMAYLPTLLADTLGLTKLLPHFLTVLTSALSFCFVHRVLTPWGIKQWSPETYSQLSARTKNQWCAHVVSQVHTIVIVPLALGIIHNESPARVNDRAFGWTEETGFVHGISCGYFLWDLYDSTINFAGASFVLHAIACFLIFIGTFKPFLAYYGTRCLLWEASTFFLNNHWFLDKTNRTGSTVQLVNAFFLLATFFGVRLIYGGIVSYHFFWTLKGVSQDVPRYYIIIYGAGNVLLQTLNWIWFGKIIAAVRRRFSSYRGRDHVKHVRTWGLSHVDTQKQTDENADTYKWVVKA